MVAKQLYKRPEEREEGLEKDVAPVGLLSEPLENRSRWSNPSRVSYQLVLGFKLTYANPSMI